MAPILGPSSDWMGCFSCQPSKHILPILPMKPCMDFLFSFARWTIAKFPIFWGVWRVGTGTMSVPNWALENWKFLQCGFVSKKWKFSYIFVNRLLANFEFWSYQTKNVDFLLTNANITKSTLLVKIWSDDPKIENLPLIHLPIYKKFFVSGQESAKHRFFTNKIENPGKLF